MEIGNCEAGLWKPYSLVTAVRFRLQGSQLKCGCSGGPGERANKGEGPPVAGRCSVSLGRWRTSSRKALGLQRSGHFGTSTHLDRGCSSLKRLRSASAAFTVARSMSS